MHEQLSRLLAGELDAAAEAALFERIATDPALAEAWAAMCALPEQLADLPLEAPPAALMDRLVAMTETFDFEPIERALEEAALDSAPFAPDPREDTLEPAVTERPRRLAAPRVERSRPERPARARAAWLGFAIAAGAIAAALFLADIVAPSPDLALPPVGESVVQGDVHVRAGDLRVHVDGRARIDIAPEEADAGEASLLLVPRGTAPVADRTPKSERTTRGGLIVTRTERSVDDGTVAARTSYTVGGSFVAERRSIVTVSVERGTATIEGGEQSVRIGAGESRSVATTAPTSRPSLRGPQAAPSEDSNDGVADPRVDPDEVVKGGATLPADVDESHLAVAELGGDLDSLPDAPWMRGATLAALADLDRHDVQLADVVCEDACVAAYLGDETTSWSSVTASLRDRLPEGVHLWSMQKELPEGLVTFYAMSPAPDLPEDLEERAVERLAEIEGE